MNCFEVAITGREPRLENGSSVVYFRIDVCIAGGYKYALYRRFSQFVTLDLALARAGHILDVKLPSRGVLRTHDEKFLRARAKGLHFYIRAAAALLTPQYRNLVDQFLCLESLRPIMFPTLCYDDDEQYITVSGRYSRAPRVHDEQAVVMRMLASSWLSFS